MSVDFFMAGVMLGVMPGVGIEVLADVSANALGFPVSTALKEFNR